MPIYEYRCQDCESHLEKMQKVSDAPLETCEKCGGKLEKQWSLSGFQFKGAGWYVTDYSNKGKSESKNDAKTETKSEVTNGTEKSSASESTAKTEGASNSTKSDVSAVKKE